MAAYNTGFQDIYKELGWGQMCDRRGTSWLNGVLILTLLVGLADFDTKKFLKYHKLSYGYSSFYFFFDAGDMGLIATNFLFREWQMLLSLSSILLYFLGMKRTIHLSILTCQQ